MTRYGHLHMTVVYSSLCKVETGTEAFEILFVILSMQSIYFGDLKESPSLGESSHVTFSRMTKYSSVGKKFACISPEGYARSSERYKNMFCS